MPGMSNASEASPAATGAVVVYPPLDASLSGGWWLALRALGPGVIVASITVGTGETIWAPRAGAIYGYALLWVITATVLCKAVLVYTGARHLVLTGEHPMQAWGRMPGPRGWMPIALGIVTVGAFPLWVAALADALGNLGMWISGQDRLPDAEVARLRPLWATASIVAAMIITVVQTYGVIEKVSAVILALKILLVAIAVVVVRPDWLSAAWSAVVPSFPAHPDWIATKYPAVAQRNLGLEIAVLLGTIGGGVQDYVGYVGLMREKKWGASAQGSAGGARPMLPLDADGVARGRRWLRAPLLDTGLSFVSVLAISGCFLMLGAAVLHPNQVVPTNKDLYSQQAAFFQAIAPWLQVVYQVGIAVAIFGALYGTFEIYSRSALEVGRAVFPRGEWRLSPVRLAVTLFAGGGGLLLLWTGWKVEGLVKLVAPLSGVLGCGLWCFAMLWTDRTQLPKAYRMPIALLGATAVVAVLLTAVGGWVALQPYLPAPLPAKP